MPADDTSDLRPDAGERAEQADATTLYNVTVTTPGSGRVQTVQVPARSPQSAFPIACAWYPLLPLTGADVQVVAVEPAPRAPAPAQRSAA